MGHLRTLDALRGVAALAVVVFHMHAIGIAGRAAPHGYLAVDFFFELSGLVLALAYRRKREIEMSFGDFATRRLVRIYPLALLGVLLGTIVALAQWLKQPGTSLPLGEIASSAAFNTFLLPNPFSTAASLYGPFPTDGPVWSLFFELGINVAWGAVLWRLSKNVLFVLCGFSALWLAVQVFAHGDADMGSSWMTFSGGLARVCFGFLLGTLIEIGAWRLPAPRTPFFAGVLGAVLLGALLLPSPSNATPLYDLACIFALFPAILIFGMAQREGGGLGRLLGEVSYPLYALHYPLLIVARLVYRSASSHIPEWFFCAMVLAACALVSYVALRIYDFPVRQRINVILRSRGHEEAVSNTHDADPAVESSNILMRSVGRRYPSGGVIRRRS